MKKYRVICNEGTSFLSRTLKEGIGEEEMPKDLDYIRDLWNVTIEEIEDPNYSYELGDISDWQYDSSKVSLYR